MGKFLKRCAPYVLTILGAAAVLAGIAQVSTTAAWVLGGVLAMSAGLLVDFGGDL
jgi:hypothetical protein